MINQKRRPSFRPRHSNNKSGYRGRSNGTRPNNGGHFQNNNNGNNFVRNGSMTNPFNVEKTIQKFQQLAKDAQTSGDPVLVENYLQHADLYARRLTELNSRSNSDSNIKPEGEQIKSEAPSVQKELSPNIDSVAEKQDQ